MNAFAITARFYIRCNRCGQREDELDHDASDEIHRLSREMRSPVRLFLT